MDRLTTLGGVFNVGRPARYLPQKGVTDSVVASVGQRTICTNRAPSVDDGRFRTKKERDPHI